MKLKLTCLSFFLITTIISYSQENNSTDIISVTVEIIGSGTQRNSLNNPHEKSNALDYFTLLTVTNNVDTAIHFTTMLCSWEENWRSSNDSIRLYHPWCDMNFPVDLTLEPRQSIKFYGSLRARDENIKSRNFKLGFILFKKEDFEHSPESHEEWVKLVNKRKIHWSNELKLQDHLYNYKIDGYKYDEVPEEQTRRNIY